MSTKSRVYADLCHLWEELAVLPTAPCARSQRERQELTETVLRKLPQIKYFKNAEGSLLKISTCVNQRGVVEVLDVGGLSEGQPAHLILGTLPGWCEALPFVRPASAAEYYEALDIVLDAEAKVLLIERVGGC